MELMLAAAIVCAQWGWQRRGIAGLQRPRCFVNVASSL